METVTFRGHESFLARFLLVRLVRFAGHYVLTSSTPMGRKLRPKLLHQSAPLVRVKPKDLIARGSNEFREWWG